MCADPRRDDHSLLVVEQVPDLRAMEQTGEYRGRYHVLGGVISPLAGVGPEQLRVASLLERLGQAGAQEPAAGFFTLWLVPARAFGRAMADATAFNLAMIQETGVVGVHFPGYLRYAVCADVEALADDIDAAFAKAAVSY